MLIRRGRRVADYLNSMCTAVCVGQDPELDRYLEFCRNLRIAIEVIDAGKQGPARAVSDYARGHGITQIFATRYAPDVQKLVHQARDMQVTIVSERMRSAPERARNT
jgi:K+-sensing histidine kinase KdpD